MASLVPSTTLLAGAATTLQSIITVTATATVAPPALYYNGNFGTLSTLNVCIFLSTLLVSVLIGWNRLITVPLVASFCAALANGLEFYAWESRYPLPNQRAAQIIADTSWVIQDLTLTLYSFVLLEKILRGRQRYLFMAPFAFLFVSIIGLRGGIIVLHFKAFKNWAYYDTVGEVTRVYFIALALLEINSAFFLLKVFYAARRRSAKLNARGGTGSHSLFTQLAHSSEVRVAMLAGVGITRAICFPFKGEVYMGIDRAAYVVDNAFPIILIIDLLTTRVMKLQAAMQEASGFTGSDFKEKVVATGDSNGSSQGVSVLGSINGKEGSVEMHTRELTTPHVPGAGLHALAEGREDVEFA